MAAGKIVIEQETRLCYVCGKKCLFHRWIDRSKVIDASPLHGGQITNSKNKLYGYRPEWCEYDISPWLRRARRRIYAEWYNLVYKVENWYKSRREERMDDGHIDQ